MLHTGIIEMKQTEYKHVFTHCRGIAMYMDVKCVSKVRLQPPAQNAQAVVG
jgi:hypothetical protein